MHPDARERRDDGRVFILYAVIAGLVIGLVSGGSITRLGELKLAWAPVIVLGMAGQVLLFSTPVGDALGPAAPAAYVASNLAVLAAVWRNISIPGLPLSGSGMSKVPAVPCVLRDTAPVIWTGPRAVWISHMPRPWVAMRRMRYGS